MKTIAQTRKDLAGGMKSRGLVEECLARVSDPAGEGARTFLKVYAEEALAAADFYDRLRANGTALPPFAGIPISIKDLFDVAGDVTTAGSLILRDAAPATRDSPSPASASILITARRSTRSTARPAVSPAVRPRAPRFRSVTAWQWVQLAPTPAAPAAFPQRFAELPASSPRPYGYRNKARFRCR
jgi:hypothetical protein